MSFIVFCKEAFDESGDAILSEIDSRGWNTSSCVEEDNLVVVTFTGAPCDRVSASIVKNPGHPNVVKFVDFNSREVI